MRIIVKLLCSVNYSLPDQSLLMVVVYIYIVMSVLIVSMHDEDDLTYSFTSSPPWHLSEYNTVVTNNALRIFQTRWNAELSY
jgi:hypothetical protein